MLPACLACRGSREPWGIKATGVACAICRTGRTTTKSFPDSDQDAEDFEKHRSRKIALSCLLEVPCFIAAPMNFLLLNTLHSPEPATSFSEHSRMATMCLASNEGQRVIQLCIASRGKGHRGLAERMLIAPGSTRFYVLVCSVAQSHLILCNPMDCSPLGSSIHGMSQARISEWDAISFSRASSRPRGQTCISCVFCIGRQILNH